MRRRQDGTNGRHASQPSPLLPSSFLGTYLDSTTLLQRLLARTSTNFATMTALKLQVYIRREPYQIYRGFDTATLPDLLRVTDCILWLQVGKHPTPLAEWSTPPTVHVSSFPETWARFRFQMLNRNIAIDLPRSPARDVSHSTCTVLQMDR